MFSGYDMSIFATDYNIRSVGGINRGASGVNQSL